MLSCADPQGTPFFNDELFRWLLHHTRESGEDGDDADAGADAGAGAGANVDDNDNNNNSSNNDDDDHADDDDNAAWLYAKIAYTRREYAQLVSRAHAVRARLEGKTGTQLAALEELQVKVQGDAAASSLPGGLRDAKRVDVGVVDVEKAAWVFAREAEERDGARTQRQGRGGAPPSERRRQQERVQTLREHGGVSGPPGTLKAQERVQPVQPGTGIMPFLRKSTRRVGKVEGGAATASSERQPPVSPPAKRQKKAS